jgi:hypothetical protein
VVDDAAGFWGGELDVEALVDIATYIDLVIWDTNREAVRRCEGRAACQKGLSACQHVCQYGEEMVFRRGWSRKALEDSCHKVCWKVSLKKSLKCVVRRRLAAWVAILGLRAGMG